MKKHIYPGTWEDHRSFSPLVETEGGRILWIAGHAARRDAAGRSLAGNFDAQARQTFANLAATLGRAGAGLQNIVTMTVFLTDARFGDRFVEIRKEFFPATYPASTLITVAGLAQPDMLVEIQGVAVVSAADPD